MPFKKRQLITSVHYRTDQDLVKPVCESVEHVPKLVLNISSSQTGKKQQLSSAWITRPCYHVIKSPLNTYLKK